MQASSKNVVASVPFTRIAFYKKVDCTVGGFAAVHAIVKYKPSIVAPTFNDTFFYSIPLKDRAVNQGGTQQFQNAILAFTCVAQANAYCCALNGHDTYRKNHDEPVVNKCRTDAMTVNDLSFYAHNLCLPVCIVCNSWCEGQHREPWFEVMIA